jgi:hypothetical protein
VQVAPTKEAEEKRKYAERLEVAKYAVAARAAAETTEDAGKARRMEKAGGVVGVNGGISVESMVGPEVVDGAEVVETLVQGAAGDAPAATIEEKAAETIALAAVAVEVSDVARMFLGSSSCTMLYSFHHLSAVLPAETPSGGKGDETLSPAALKRAHSVRTPDPDQGKLDPKRSRHDSADTDAHAL